MSRPKGSKNKTVSIKRKSFADKQREQREYYRVLLNKTELTQLENAELLHLSYIEYAEVSTEITTLNKKTQLYGEKKNELVERIKKLTANIDVEVVLD